MPFHIKNPDTDALARRYASLKKLGLTEAVHLALEEALMREAAKPSLPDVAAGFYRELKARSLAAKAAGQAAGKPEGPAPDSAG
jgi:antitoxin VapB